MPTGVEAAPATRASASTRAIVATTLAVLAVPVIVDLLVSGRKRVFAYFAADAFYYLQVARNIGEHASVSFDRSHATNGFHPLWQALLGGEWGIGHAIGLSDTVMLYVAIITGLVLVGVTLVLLARVLERAYGRLTPLFVLLPVGLYALLFLPVWIGYGGVDPAKPNGFEGPMPLYGTLWSYVNGMETPVVLVAYALVGVMLVVRPPTSRRSALLLGGALAVLVLARLDTVFVAAAVLGMLLLIAAVRRDRTLARVAGLAGGLLGAVLLAYLIVNQLYAGTFLPVSGTLKSTFPEPSLGNWRDLRSLLEGNTLLAPERLYRQFPTLVPAAFAVAYLALAHIRTLVRQGIDDPRARYRVFLVATAAGVLALSLYNWFFVAGFNQGHWYYPISTLFVSLAALDWLSGVRIESRAAIAVASAGAIVATVVFVTVGRRADYHRRFADFYYEAAPRLRDTYEGGVPDLLSIDDGIDAFSLDAPAMSGIGLALDEEAVEALERDELVPLAVGRGFDRISSLAYFDATGLNESTPSDAVRGRVAELVRRSGRPAPDLSGYDFRVERRVGPGEIFNQWPNTDGSYVIIRVEPRQD